ncbi:MAG: putative lipid II flippase FtsW [Ruminococcaceae bacterium]|nr:putative lipid II flippase FtsW [Oscillospiraceae bacterium]
MKNNKKIINAAPVPANGGKNTVASRGAFNPDEYRVVRGGVDNFLLFTILILLAFGLIMVFSASYADARTRYGDSYYFIKRQSIMVIIGLVTMVVASRLRITFYKNAAVLAYGFSAVLLFAVLFAGDTGGGAQRWIELGPLRFQPSEMAKYSLILMLAWYYSKYAEKAFDMRNNKNAYLYGTMIPLVFIGFICVLVMLEKHLSGIIIIGCIGLMVMFVSGIKLKLLGLFAAIGVAGVAAIAIFTDYTKRRIDIWLNPEQFPREGGWQTLQGLRAIGSGGLFGLGLGNSRQKYSYVSQPQNDFIFTITCEELGFIGAAAVIVLFGLLVWRGVVIALRAPDRFSQLVAVGITFKVALQVILNIAVVTNSIPNTGISLPFFSYGGTAMVVQLAEMGTLLAISRHTLEKK